MLRSDGRAHLQCLLGDQQSVDLCYVFTACLMLNHFCSSDSRNRYCGQNRYFPWPHTACSTSFYWSISRHLILSMNLLTFLIVDFWLDHGIERLTCIGCKHFRLVSQPCFLTNRTNSRAFENICLMLLKKAWGTLNSLLSHIDFAEASFESKSSQDTASISLSRYTVPRFAPKISSEVAFRCYSGNFRSHSCSFNITPHRNPTSVKAKYKYVAK